MLELPRIVRSLDVLAGVGALGLTNHSSVAA